MSANRFGDLFSVTTFGESHGPAMGAIIEGCPAGLEWRQDLLEKSLARRRPGQSALVSGRQELDKPEVLSGVFDGKTLGTPIAIVVRNQNAQSSEYDSKKLESRQGHATDLWQAKFGHSDPRGSGRASGRETICRVMGGSVAQMLIEKLHPEVRTLAFTSAIGEIGLSEVEIEQAYKVHIEEPWSVDQFSLRCPDLEKNQLMEALLIEAKASGESYGGIGQVCISGLPMGLGQPVFRKLKTQLAQGMMSIGATMGFLLGDGFSVAKLPGSYFHSGKQKYGGIRGGISTGDMITLQVAFKPTSSTGKIAKEGRHDPCIVPRALPVMESMVWLVIADQLLHARLDRV